MNFPDTIWIRHNGNFVHKDKYDGDEIELHPGDIKQLHLGCAELCFGFGRDDKLPTLRRLGWVDTQADSKAGLDKLNSFSFHENERAANNHRAIKPTAPAEGAAAVEPAGASAPADKLHLPDKGSNLLRKIATVE